MDKGTALGAATNWWVDKDVTVRDAVCNGREG
jgi:hypothetical protein